jgi:hypothetical protein
MSFLAKLFDAVSYVIFYGIDDNDTIETIYTESDKLSYDTDSDSDIDDTPDYSNFINYSIQTKATRRAISFC